MASISGGNKLEAYLANLARKVSVPATLEVGFFEGSTEPDGTPVPLVAALNEFGTSKAPPRPFFRRMIAAKSGEWGPAVGALLKANDMDAKKALGLAGEGIEGQLKQSIVDLTDPPLAASTIKRKGFAKPLIASGTMLRSTGYRVK